MTYSNSNTWTGPEEVTQSYIDYLKSKLRHIADMVMVVDVEDGCIEGRKKFIRDHIGEEYMPNQEVVLVVRMPRSNYETDDWENIIVDTGAKGLADYDWIEVPEQIKFSEIKGLIEEVTG